LFLPSPVSFSAVRACLVYSPANRCVPHRYRAAGASSCHPLAGSPLLHRHAQNRRGNLAQNRSYIRARLHQPTSHESKLPCSNRAMARVTLARATASKSANQSEGLLAVGGHVVADFRHCRRVTQVLPCFKREIAFQRFQGADCLARGAVCDRPISLGKGITGITLTPALNSDGDNP
jgi:hypothetical protein